MFRKVSKHRDVFLWLNINFVKEDTRFVTNWFDIFEWSVLNLWTKRKLKAPDIILAGINWRNIKIISVPNCCHFTYSVSNFIIVSFISAECISIHFDIDLKYYDSRKSLFVTTIINTYLDNTSVTIAFRSNVLTMSRPLYYTASFDAKTSWISPPSDAR